MLSKNSSKSKSLSAQSNAIFYNKPPKVLVLYTGFLHRSPALSGFTRRMKAWRRRFFVLSKTGDDLYQLTYYKNETKRDKPLGEIDLSRVGLICTCPEKHPMLDWIQKNFRCPPSSVLLLRVNDFMPKSARDYFLIGENSEDVNGWEKELVKVIRAQTENDESLQQDNRDRAKSEPTARSEHYDERLHTRFMSQGFDKPSLTETRPLQLPEDNSNFMDMASIHMVLQQNQQEGTCFQAKGDQILTFSDLQTDIVEDMQTYPRRSSNDEDVMFR